MRGEYEDWKHERERVAAGKSPREHSSWWLVLIGVAAVAAYLFAEQQGWV